MAGKSYPPQHTDDTLKVFGFEPFADLNTIVLTNEQAKLRMEG
jgi:hypothetical protein